MMEVLEELLSTIRIFWQTLIQKVQGFANTYNTVTMFFNKVASFVREHPFLSVIICLGIIVIIKLLFPKNFVGVVVAAVIAAVIIVAGIAIYIAPPLNTIANNTTPSEKQTYEQEQQEETDEETETDTESDDDFPGDGEQFGTSIDDPVPDKLIVG